MRLRSVGFALALVAAAIVGLGSSAQANIIVTTASGNIGNFNAVNEGVVGNTATILFNIPQVSAQINTVNGGVVVPPEPVMVNTPLTLLVTSLGGGNYGLALSPASAKEIVGANVGAQAILDFGLQTGTTTTVLPAFFNASGRITGLEANLDPALDFQKFASPLGGVLNLTLTGTTFSAGVTSFDQFFATAGATAVGNGSFSQAAVPEPGMMSLVGLGLTTVGLVRMVRRKRARARARAHACAA